MLLKDKVAVITGASSGIGAAAARLFAAEGASVVLGARREAALRQISEEISDVGGQAVWLAGDVADAAYAAALTDRAQAAFGRLDIGFNNAGMLGPLAPVTELRTEDWDTVLRTNLTSAFHLARAQLPSMQKAGGGSIIFTSSFVGFETGMPGMAAYAAAKAGLVGLARALAVETGADGIRVNALLPGGTDTPMAAEFGSDPDTQAFVRNLHALKRIAEPAEIARSALYLASDMSSFVTGTTLLADGGNAICKT